MEDKISVVIVDENAEFASLICRFFSGYFNIAGIAHNVADAHNIILQQHPDIVLLEVKMPEAEALRLIKLVKHDALPKKPEFVIMGAAGVECVMQFAQSLGAIFCMVKPFDFGMAVERINTICVYLAQEQNNYSSRMMPEKNKSDAELKIIEMLHKMGLTPNIQGFQYLKESVLIALKNGEYEDKKSSPIYTLVALKNNTTPARVERAIHYAKILAASRGRFLTNDIFDLCMRKNGQALPTNIELIKALCSRIIVT